MNAKSTQPYAILVISTHGALRTKRTTKTVGGSAEFKTFTLPVDVYKIDATKPGMSYFPPTDTFNVDIKKMIIDLVSVYKDNEPYNKLKEILPRKLKMMDKSYDVDDGDYEYRGTEHQPGNKIYNKMYSFNSDEVQISTDFSIELFVSDEYNNIDYENITEEVFGLSNIRHTKTPRNYEILLSKLLYKVDYKIVNATINRLVEQGRLHTDANGEFTKSSNDLIDSMIDYNYILIDLTCSDIRDAENREHDDRTARLLRRRVVNDQ
jgi:hypothetical protein